MTQVPAALLALSLFAATSAATQAPSAPDSMVIRLKRAETVAGPRAAADAALSLGRLYYARGEYRPAADAFSRAAARLGPARKGEALYWTGMAWLGLNSPNAARAAFDEVVSAGDPRRNDALLGTADAWVSEDRFDKAFATLQQLISGDMGPAGPAALERMSVVAERLNRAADAERAKARLLSSYPGSMEALALVARDKETAPAAPTSGPVAVEAGRFANAARARGLVVRAQRAGYKDARVVEHVSAATRSFAVRLGSYPDRPSAREAQLRAAKELGLTARITGDR